MENIGFSNDGTNCHGINVYHTEMNLEFNRKFNFGQNVTRLIHEEEYLRYV